METSLKIIVTSKINLQTKYKEEFSVIESLLKKLITFDATRKITTKIVYIDDKKSCSAFDVDSVTSVTRQSSKLIIDSIYQKHHPSYIVIFGSRDIIPFQELKNSIPKDAGDDDDIIPTDLPYACDTKYGNDVSSFVGPTRVVGRIPDITGLANVGYVSKIIQAIITYKPQKEEQFLKYFSITAKVWEKSTQESLTNIFGNSTTLKSSPPNANKYSESDLSPLIHFYNCHGSSIDSSFYGQSGNNFPVAISSDMFEGKISKGAIVAAECCYGAELYNPNNEDKKQYPISNTYLGNSATAFVGSSTIAYGPSEGQGLADLITQYFIKKVLSGASTGRAMLEARQQFLAASGSLDPYEMKTIAQFYLLGDPSVQPVLEQEIKSSSISIKSRRHSLSNKGISLGQTVAVSKNVDVTKQPMGASIKRSMSKIFKTVGFTGKEKSFLFEVNAKKNSVSKLAKSVMGNGEISYRTFVQKSKKVSKNLTTFDVLVMKESGDKLLGWKLYHRK